MGSNFNYISSSPKFGLCFKMWRKTYFQLSLVSLIIFFHAVHGRLTEEDIIQDLFKNYNRRLRPPSVELNGNGTEVSINLDIRSIEIDDIKMEHNVQMICRQYWQDLRLAYNEHHIDRKYVTLTESRRLWLPDLFFTNEKSGYLHDIISPNIYTRIYPNGDVLYVMRLTMKFSCPMQFQLFPHDKQLCSIRMSSYGHTTDDVILKWKEGNSVNFMNVTRSAVEKLTPERYITDSCDSHTNTGTYSCIRLDLFFKRNFHHYLTHVYIPTLSLVIAAWFSFWITKKNLAGRALLTLTAYGLLVYTAMDMNRSAPSVGYTRGIDIWTGICLAFVFFTIGEFTFVHFLSKREVEDSTSHEIFQHEKMSRKEHGISSCWKEALCSDRVDIVSRILYPLAFVIFICLYVALFIGVQSEEGWVY